MVSNSTVRLQDGLSMLDEGRDNDEVLFNGSQFC